jgi:hypothetical protein
MTYATSWSPGCPKSHNAELLLGLPEGERELRSDDDLTSELIEDLADILARGCLRYRRIAPDWRAQYTDTAETSGGLDSPETESVHVSVVNAN